MADFKPVLSRFDGFCNKITENSDGSYSLLIGCQPGYKKDLNSEFVPQGDYISFSVYVPAVNQDAYDLIRKIKVDDNGKPAKPTKLYFNGGLGFIIKTKPNPKGGVWVNLNVRLAPWSLVSLTPYKKGENGEPQKKAGNDPETPSEDDFDPRY